MKRPEEGKKETCPWSNPIKLPSLTNLPYSNRTKPSICVSKTVMSKKENRQQVSQIGRE
jgi:hypothetical protein